MALFPVNTDYTSKDFDSLLLRLQALARSAFPEWTDFNVANFGNLLLELFAFSTEILTFYQDSQAAESRIVTATQRKNVIALAKLIGFRLAGASAATADVRFTLAAIPTGDVTIPAGTVVRTQEVTDPIRFQLLAPVTIGAGANPPEATGTVENSQTRIETFPSTELANQEFVLTFTPFLDGSAQVAATNGAFAEVENFLNSTPTDRHFSVVVDQNDRATIRMGNGVQGAIPAGTVTITYKTGGGANANVDELRIVVMEGSFTDAFGNPVQVSVTNPNPAAGGTPRESLASAKVRAPASLRTLNRTVSREDYENNARTVPGVARALMLTSNEDPTIGENSGILFVIPRGGGAPSQALKDAVLNQVTVVFPNTLTFVVSVQDPVFCPIDVQARVFLRPGVRADAVAAAIESALVDFFAVSLADGTPNPQVDFGFAVKDAQGNPAGEVAWSTLHALVAGLPGVRKLGDQDPDFLLNGRSDDVPLANREFPKLGAVTLINGDTGGLLA